MPHPQTGKDYVHKFWDLYIQAANELVVADPTFRFSLDLSGAEARNRSVEILGPLYKRVLHEIVDRNRVIDGFAQLANQESQQWFESRCKVPLGSQRGRCVFS